MFKRSSLASVHACSHSRRQRRVRRRLVIRARLLVPPSCAAGAGAVRLPARIVESTQKRWVALIPLIHEQLLRARAELQRAAKVGHREHRSRGLVRRGGVRGMRLEQRAAERVRLQVRHPSVIRRGDRLSRPERRHEQYCEVVRAVGVEANDHAVARGEAGDVGNEEKADDA
eukprot:4488659-Prymnesium_polylepis.1